MKTVLVLLLLIACGGRNETIATNTSPPDLVTAGNIAPAPSIPAVAILASSPATSQTLAVTTTNPQVTATSRHGAFPRAAQFASLASPATSAETPSRLTAAPDAPAVSWPDVACAEELLGQNVCARDERLDQQICRVCSKTSVDPSRRYHSNVEGTAMIEDSPEPNALPRGPMKMYASFAEAVTAAAPGDQWIIGFRFDRPAGPAETVTVEIITGPGVRADGTSDDPVTVSATKQIGVAAGATSVEYRHAFTTADLGLGFSARARGASTWRWTSGNITIYEPQFRLTK
jgi:hypothetical protein